MSGSAGSGVDEISILVGNTWIRGWEKISITRSLEHFPNSFVLTATDQYPYDADRATLFPGGPGQLCFVLIGNDVVITGYVDRYVTSISPNSHELSIVGRGTCSDLVDCSIDPDAPGMTNMTIQAANTLDLAQKLAKPFGITARLAISALGPGLPALTFELGETPYEVLERVCRFTGFLAYEDENGFLVLDRVGTKKMASGFTMPGNIESASASLSFDQRYSKYTVVWSSVAQFSDVSPLANQRATVTDPTMPKSRFRPRIIVSEQTGPSPGPNGAEDYWGKTRANWEMARRIGRSQAIELTCDSWRDAAGKLWQPNYLAPVHAAPMKIVNAEWVIGSVVFRKDQSGTHADLTLMPPDAFRPEPVPLTLWDLEIMRARQNSPNPAPPTVNEAPPLSPGNGAAGV